LEDLLETLFPSPTSPKNRSRCIGREHSRHHWPGHDRVPTLADGASEGNTELPARYDMTAQEAEEQSPEGFNG
jgi:hypothetical protein